MSGKRRKALRKGRVRLEGVRARTLRGVSWSETPPRAVQPREKAHKHAPLEAYEPTPGSKKALLQQKRLLGKQTPSEEEKERFARRLRDLAANATYGQHYRALWSWSPERKNRVVFR